MTKKLLIQIKFFYIFIMNFKKYVLIFFSGYDSIQSIFLLVDRVIDRTLQENFMIKEFFEEPHVGELFVEVDPYQVQDEEGLFCFERKRSLEFATQMQNKFAQIVTQTLPKTVSKIHKIKKIEQKDSSKRHVAQSQITKNACFNIVQKAISMIKNQEYEQKLQQLCLKCDVEIAVFREYILRNRTRFTGIKTLQLFLQQKDRIHKPFALFLRWFMSQKYIRHAIRSGEMSNLHAYIRFKNEVMLPLLLLL